VKTKKETVRIAGKLKEIISIFDHKGNIIHKVVSPVMIEFYPRDLMQIVIGSTILAVPVAFTQETWDLASSLPLLNINIFLAASILFISAFVYYNFYRNKLSGNVDHFVKRTISTYVLSFLVVTALLVLIERAPWLTDSVLAYKRSVLVAFPASMSAAIADMIK
tara:strand:- start:9304 stop:9795 length:492 start_codon:yes stop_codon:yes gene_type:complete